MSWFDDGDILSVCLRLRMACNGSADPMSSDDVRGALAFLKSRVREWRPSARPSEEAFDGAVYSLILATIEEVELQVRTP